jgi:hypothetical protein
MGICQAVFTALVHDLLRPREIQEHLRVPPAADSSSVLRAWRTSSSESARSQRFPAGEPSR